jgi:hypothetical protein
MAELTSYKLMRPQRVLNTKSLRQWPAHDHSHPSSFPKILQHCTRFSTQHYCYLKAPHSEPPLQVAHTRHVTALGTRWAVTLPLLLHLLCHWAALPDPVELVLPGLASVLLLLLLRWHPGLEQGTQHLQASALQQVHTQLQVPARLQMHPHPAFPHHPCCLYIAAAA